MNSTMGLRALRTISWSGRLRRSGRAGAWRLGLALTSRNSAMITFGSVTRGLSNHHRFARTDRAANRKPATSPDRCDHIIVQLTQAVGLEVPV